MDGDAGGWDLTLVAITLDNLHLSEPIPHADAPTNPVAASCSDPMVLHFVEAATAPNTRRAYDSDLKHFLAWGGSLPASPDVVARYLAAHATTHAVATLARHLVAIRRAHGVRGLPDPVRSELVRLTFRGIRRAHGRPQRRAAALTVEQIAVIMASLGDSVRDVRDRALLLIGFAGAFRRSELSGIDCKSIDRSARGIVITVSRSKTDQEGQTRQVAIHRGRNGICPIKALDQWLQLSGITEGPVFRPVSRRGHVLPGQLSGDSIATVVKQRVSAIGLDPTPYSGHSLRAGFVTSAASVGTPAWRIKAQTGHVSDALVGRYIRLSDPFATASVVAIF
jgi:integrase